MRAEPPDVLKRLKYIEGHLKGIQNMVEEDRYCVEILRQTYAVRMAIAKIESLLVEQHLRTCVPHMLAHNQIEAVIAELVQLYALDRE